ncbi:MAG: endo-1,4-beta-xylanase [Sphingomonas sp.]
MDLFAPRRDFLMAMCTVPFFGLASADEQPFAASGSTVDAPPPRRPTRVFGTAVRPVQLATACALRDAIDTDCGLLVPEYHGQWSAVEWRRGDPWYGNYDAITAYAAARGMQVRGHSLIWEQMTPGWARDDMLHARDWRTVERHFANLLPRYRGAIGEWIVVNEMIDTEHGDNGLRRTSFQRAYGNDYVRRALETAHICDPDTRLMINDFSMLHDNPVDEARRRRMLGLVEQLKRDGVPLHAVGLQGHLDLAKGPIAAGQVERFLADLAGMGVEIGITELDVLEDDRNDPLAARDRRVADFVRSLLDVALDQPAVRSVVTWSLDDGHSWLQDRAAQTKAAQSCTPIDCGALNRGLPYDADLVAKPMRDELQRVHTA